MSAERILLPARDTFTGVIFDREAIVLSKHGPFAVHRTLHDDDFFTLTHIRTKYAIARRLPDLESAARLAQALIEITGSEFWDFDSIHTENLKQPILRANIMDAIDAAHQNTIKGE